MVFTPYSTSVELHGQKPTWIPDELDIQRISSYQTYEQIYWNVPDVFKVALRGSNDQPIYMPTARTIVDTTLRYTAPAFKVVTSDRMTGAASVEAVAASVALRDLMKRERFSSKFSGFKRYGLIRGDAIWHVTGDETKLLGSRISLTALDPGMYFPIPDEDDVDKIVGVHLVEQLETDDGPRIRRLTYRKVEGGGISVEEGIFATDKWGGPEDKPERVITPVQMMHPSITSIPVYHVKNFEEPGNPFGSSELRGLERIMSAVNQTVSDESLALALAGIGVYATDSSQPIDPVTRKPVPWQFGPGRVVHYDGSDFKRVQGVGSVQPYSDHYERLVMALKEASATPGVAVGMVDVSVAQSGIALALQLAPMLTKVQEKNDLILDVHNQMFFDITTMWFDAYEQTAFDGVGIDCTVGDAVPVDRAARFTELNDMLDRGVIDTAFYRAECVKLGYVFPEDIQSTAAAEYQQRNADQFAARVADELTPTEDPDALA